jgi:hypothetical protein
MSQIDPIVLSVAADDSSRRRIDIISAVKQSSERCAHAGKQRQHARIRTEGEVSWSVLHGGLLSSCRRPRVPVPPVLTALFTNPDEGVPKVLHPTPLVGR